MSTIGKLFKVTTFGQSHSGAVGCIIEGFPANKKINIQYIQSQLNKRRPGQSSLTTQRKQKDKINILSGIQKGLSLGSPITFLIQNEDKRPEDYSQLKNVYRPGHADFTYFYKYGIKAQSGGGRASARETIGRVCAGALARDFLLNQFGVKFFCYVCKVGKIQIQDVNKYDLLEDVQDQIIQFQHKLGLLYYHNKKYYNQNGELINQQLNLPQNVNILKMRCPSIKHSIQMITQINKAKQNKDSVGGIVRGIINNLPIGLGQPVFDKFNAQLGYHMLSIPATKGFQIGQGFNSANFKGSQHNDKFHYKNNKLQLKTNNCGGVLGGITTSQQIKFKVAFKPVSTIQYPQQTVDNDGNDITLKIKGRHDPCVLPRVPVIVNSMSAICVMDMILMQKAKQFI